MKNKYWLKKNLFRTRDVLNDLGCSFCLTWGMCLGAIREKDIIEWDNDVDVCIVIYDKFDKELLLRIVEALRPNVEWISYECLNSDKPEPKPGTSITFCYKDNSFSNQIEFCIIEGDVAKHYCPKGVMYFPSYMFQYLIPITFLEGRFLIPTDTETYLERCYGKNWRISKKEGYNADMRWDEGNR